VQGEQNLGRLVLLPRRPASDAGDGLGVQVEYLRLRLTYASFDSPVGPLFGPAQLGPV
jgi:hypothetical protein